MRRLTILLLALVVATFFSVAQAEIKVLTGTGEYYMEDDSQTLDYCKKQAKILAMLDIVEQASVYLVSDSAVKDFNLTKEEVETIAAGLVYPVAEKYSIAPSFNDMLVVKVEVTAEIDTDKIPELIERERKLRAEKN